MDRKANLSISRPSFGDGKKKIRISIQDESSRIRFVDLDIDLDKFAECITGLSYVECDMVIRNLENVGRVKESIPIEFKMPEPSYMMDKDEICRLAELNTPDGWICSKYFSSQNSFFNVGGVNFARTTAHRWVDKEPKSTTK